MHIPVLAEELISLINPQKNGLYVDVTVGCGGHAKKILDLCGDCKVIGFDVDGDVLDIARKTLQRHGERVKLIKTNYSQIKKVLDAENLTEVNGIIADLGYSSFQIENMSRGFSFNSDSELDMRMSGETELKSSDVVNSYSVDELENIFNKYSDERYARRIAEKIEFIRKTKEIKTCKDLAEIAESVYPKKRGQQIHPATRIFQALRIYINKELENLSELLKNAPAALSVGGRIAIISYHSGEDRIVKNGFKELQRTGEFKTITKKPIIPSSVEIQKNSRARSAKLRCAEKQNIGTI